MSRKMEEDEYLSRVQTDYGNYYLLVQKLCQEIDDFDLYVTDGCDVWGTKVTEDMLKEMATKVEMNLRQYVQQCLEALTCQHSESEHFIYQVVKNDSALELSWKQLLDGGVKYQLGSMSLTLKDKNKRQLMQRILNFSITKIQEYKDNISSMKSNIEQLSKDRSNAILRLEKCVVSKEEMEIGLFQKFVTVLNDKKAKIRRLQETTEQLQSKTALNPDSNKNKDAIHPRSNTTNITDDTDAQSSHSMQAKESEQSNASSSIDSDLFKKDEDTGPVLKRRGKRTRQQAKETTQTKPVLPEVKVTPVKRTTSNASTDDRFEPSVGAKRSSRKKKNISTFPDDVEELFGDMA